MKAAAYIYPNSVKKREVTNPYINDFVDSLSNSFVFLNKDKPSTSGIIDLLKYIPKLDFIFLNWIEDLPDKKRGLLQSFIFLSLIPALKLKGIKIFYVLHNKESHYSSNQFLKNAIRKAVFKNADYIICHSSEGLKIKTAIRTKNIRYIPHPFKNFNETVAGIKKEYDILIWGSIRPYKGITDYLHFLEMKNLLNRYNTLIVGKIFPQEYENELMKYKSAAIHIENRFINDQELNVLIDKSKVVLFTYNEKSVLSSGALVYSLSQGAMVIGPKTGAFHDLYTEGIVDVFDDYDELIKKIDYRLNHPNQLTLTISDFVNKNSWQNFGAQMENWLLKKKIQ